MGWPGTSTGPELNPTSFPEVTPKPEMLEAPVLATKTQLVLVVLAEIPADEGEAPVDSEAGLKAVKAPVTGLYRNCPTCAELRSSTYTKSAAGSTMNAVGPQQAATEEPEESGVNVPSGAAHVAEVWIHAENMLISLEPAFDTKRLLASAVAQTVVAVATPAQRENAKPPGAVPTCTQYPGAPAPQGLGFALGKGVSAPLLS